MGAWPDYGRAILSPAFSFYSVCCVSLSVVRSVSGRTCGRLTTNGLNKEGLKVEEDVREESDSP